MTVVRPLAGLVLATAVLAGLAAPAPAQQSARFWLAAMPGNMQACLSADPQFTREHTLTVNGDQAELKAAGGIATRMKQVKPNVFETDYRLGQLNLHLVADLTATPPTLLVTERNLGCKWMAKKA